MQLRRRFKQTVSLEERLALFADTARKVAEQLPAGPEKDKLLRKARQVETMTHLNEWASSPGLQPPR